TERFVSNERVFGFRSRRDRRHALAVAQHLAQTQNRFVWLTEDLRNAFDTVPLTPLKEILKTYIPSPKLVDFAVEMAATNKKRGLLQGSSLSPLLLNIYLHHILDRVWAKKFPEVPLLRYADDLLLLCRTKREADSVRKQLARILKPTGMTLKPQDRADAITSLKRRESTTWLGFGIQFSDRKFQTTIEERMFGQLQDSLERAHDFVNSPLRAMAITKAWLAQMGPCFESSDREDVLEQVGMIAEQAGFEELPSTKSLLCLWKKSANRWQCLYDELLTVPVMTNHMPTAFRRSVSRRSAQLPTPFHVGEAQVRGF
ncbi:MAG TPA: reverse transcriptase domain-containing protein, partial [Planctomicrobium sp.]|nr:reverse transcriptase domain-containing protein [Planctomicrobium sp.]